MSYPFVPAYLNLGQRKGPMKAFLIHMAEGGGTVAYLAKPNPNGVSVHYVIEYGGRIVQMLYESMASGSVNPRDIRTTDDPDGFFGATTAKAVMGDWWKDPNSAVISVEIEGFAVDGPNAKQRAALKTLVADVRSRFPEMGLLGHRDFADYKRCPGKLIPWEAIGGHGLPEEPVLDFTWIKDQPDSGPGSVTVKGTGHSAILADGTLYPLAAETEKHSYGLVKFTSGKWAGQLAYAIGDNAAFLLKVDVVYVAAVTDCTNQIAAARERDYVTHKLHLEEMYSA